MIQNDEQLQTTRDAILNLETAIASLKRDILSGSSRRFAFLSEPAVAQLRELRSAVDEYIGVEAALSCESDLRVRLIGPHVEFDDVPIDLICGTLRILQTGIQAVAELLIRGLEENASSSAIKEACELRILAWDHAGVGVALRLPDPSTLKSDAYHVAAHGALQSYLRTAHWAASEADPCELEREVPDSILRRVLLIAVSRLAPRPEADLEVVELSSMHLEGPPTPLRAAARLRADRAAEALSGALDSASSVNLEDYPFELGA